MRAALCRACETTEETMENIGLRYPTVYAPPVEGATRPQALVFQQLQPNGYDDASAMCTGADSVVTRTKRCLTETGGQWCTAAREHRTLP